MKPGLNNTSHVHCIDGYYSGTSHNLRSLSHRQISYRWPGLLFQVVNSWSCKSIPANSRAVWLTRDFSHAQLMHDYDCSLCLVYLIVCYMTSVATSLVHSIIRSFYWMLWSITPQSHSTAPLIRMYNSWCFQGLTSLAE